MADRAGGLSTTRRTAAVLALDLEIPQADPEMAGQILSSIVDNLRPVIVPYGGWLDAGTGGRVTIVFVPPFIHDAPLVAAVGAASVLRERLDSMDPSQAFGWRVGISKGEVLLEGGEIGSATIFGDPLSTSRRLARDASDGEIVLDGGSLAPIEGIVEVAPRVDDSWSLRSVRQGERPTETMTLTGRQRELTSLLDEFDRLVRSSGCSRVVITGRPGLGKSRLLEACRDELKQHAHVLVGYCDPAGGRALRPVAEMIERWLSTMPGGGPLEKLERFLGDAPGADQICGDVVQLLGRSTSTATTASISWSLRQLIERLAAERPVVLVFEDLHWGRDLLIDTIEYLTAFITDKPVLIVCAGRPDLLDRSEALSHVSRVNMVLALDPLGLAATTELVARVIGSSPPQGLAEEVHRISKGNPLFAIELAEEWRRSPEPTRSVDELGSRVAPTLQALLETRVAGVEEEVRPILQAAAVAGERFDVAQVAAAAEWDHVATLLQLARLADHHLVEPARASAALGRDEFRFGHALIQETVYRMTEKEQRVNLHRRFADLELDGAAGVDEHERAGYHLERAGALSAELGRPDEEVDRLRDRAASLFAKAGRELMASGDVNGVATLLQKAIDLLSERGPEWANTAIDLADVYVQLGDYERARRLTQEVGELAASSSSAIQKERAALAAGWLRAATVLTPQPDLVADLQALAPLFERRADHTALAKLHFALAACHWTGGENGAVVEVLRRGMDHSLRSPSQRHLSRMAPFMASALLWGPTHTDAALEACNGLLEIAAADRLAKARVKVVAGVLEALRGNFDNATRLTEQGVSAHEEAGPTVVGLVMTQFTALVEILAGDLHSAGVELERGLAGMRAIGEEHLSTSMVMLAQVRYRLGDPEFATELIAEALALGVGEVTLVPDAYPTLGHIAADRGDHESAMRYLEGAAREAGAGDTLLLQAQVAVETARVLAKLDVERDELERAIAEASELCRRKGAPVLELRLPSSQGDPF